MPVPVALWGRGRCKCRALPAAPAQPLALRRALVLASWAAAGKAFHLLASIWVVGPVKDTQCGFKGFTRSAAHDLFARQQITSIVFDVELIFLARKRGYSLAVVPIRWADKRGSRMRARPGLALRVAWDLFRIPLVHRRVGRAAATPSHDEL